MTDDASIERVPKHLADWPLTHVVFRCDKCRREGRYRRETLVEHFGPEITLPRLREMVANCPHMGALRDPCMAYYPQLKR